MSVVRTLIPKRLTLIKRDWTLKNGTRRSAYLARIWNYKRKRTTEVTLTSSDEAGACEEAFNVWAKLSPDIEEGREISATKRRINTFVDEYMEYVYNRARDNDITDKRAEVIRHSLASLIRFWEFLEKPSVDELTRLYELRWNAWRGEEKAKITGKPLSKRFRNNELTVHKTFFSWLVANRYASRAPDVRPIKLRPEDRGNYPFPDEFYLKFLSAARKEIAESFSVKSRWNRMNVYYLVLLMNGIGCRVTEAKRLTWSDLKTRKGGTFLRLHGKDKEREILLPDRVAGYLNDLREWKRKNGSGWWSEERCPAVLCAWKSDRPPNQFKAEVRRRWSELAGVPNPNDYEFVSFRHRFITNALINGARSLEIAVYTGTSQNMIEKTYSGLVPANVFDLVFKNATPESLARNPTPKWIEKLGDE